MTFFSDTSLIRLEFSHPNHFRMNKVLNKRCKAFSHPFFCPVFWSHDQAKPEMTHFMAQPAAERAVTNQNGLRQKNKAGTEIKTGKIKLNKEFFKKLLHLPKTTTNIYLRILNKILYASLFRLKKKLTKIFFRPFFANKQVQHCCGVA